MEYLVYHISSTMPYRSFKRLADAKRVAQKLNEKERDFLSNIMTEDAKRERVRLYGALDMYGVAERLEYENEVVYWEEQTNLMSKRKYWEKSNTPSYCSPAREAYWSM